MKSPNKRYKFCWMLKVAALGGLLITTIALIINLFIQYHGTENGEHSWMYSFILLQGVPFSIFLQFLSPSGIEYISGKILFCILVSMVDGVVMFLLLISIASIWWLLTKGNHENKS